MNPTRENSDLVATTIFRLCRKPNASAVAYRLSVTPSPIQSELEIMTALGENGRTSFCTFHEAREACVVSRPLSDLINIWHPDKIEGSTFCLHLHARQFRLADEALSQALTEWRAGEATATEVSGSQATSPTEIRVARGKSASGQSKDGDAVILHVTFPQEEGSVLDAEVWSGVEVSVPLTARVETIPVVVMKEMQKLLRQDKRLFAMLQEGKNRLTFKPYLQFKDCRDCYVDLEHGRVVVQTIARLFSEPSEQAREIEVMVEVEGESCDMAPSKPAEAVVPFVCELSEMFRLGRVQDVTSSGAKAKTILCETAIIGALDVETGLRLGAVTIFAVNNMSIGDCYAGAMLSFKESYAWADKYWGARTLEDLATMVRAHRNDRLKPGQELPIRPDYTFERFDAGGLKLGLIRWPSSGVHLTIRCVSMLPLDDMAFVFPALKYTQYTLEAVDTVDSVKMMIREEMRAKRKDGRTCGSLFQKDVVGRWDLVLWTLPQIDGMTTLHRWLGGPVTQFMRSKGKTDGRLYVEAHVVEVRRDEEQDEEEQEAGGGRLDAADGMDGQSEGLFISQA
ncbi:hypothetical protein LTR53_003956 [Teratosphaeriaceae sp. CCFEE 6253]|nr:hypothetical protein LTR53_003956 [Teratosphaeriaceae sp. CCFEE 6253]